MQHFYQKKVLALSLVLSCPLLCSAGLFADLNSVVMSNSTAPQTLHTNDRSAIFGGSFEMRVPVNNINIATFNPPRFDAGCNGINLSLGSFSFINKDQIIKDLKQIAAGSSALLFKAAIDAISPNLSKLMDYFHDQLMKLNRFFGNTCQAASMLANGAKAQIKDVVNADGLFGAQQKNVVQDSSDSVDKVQANGSSAVTGMSGYAPLAGNVNMKAIVKSQATARWGGPGLPNSDGTPDDPSDPTSLNNSILISMMGFETGGTACQNQDLSGNPQAAATTAAFANAISCKGNSTIRLKHLIDGGGDGSTDSATPLLRWVCTNPSGSVSGGIDPQICTSMQQKTWNYPGIKGFVNNALFGVPDSANINNGNIDANSIVGLMNAGQFRNLTSTQKQFLNASGIKPKLLFKSPNSDVRTYVAVKLSEYVTQCMSARIGMMIWQGANSMTTGHTYEITEEAKANIAILEKDWKKENDLCRNSKTIVDAMNQIEVMTRLIGSDKK